MTKIVITNSTDSLVFLFTEVPSASLNMSVAPPAGDSDDLAQQAQNMTFGDPGSFTGSAYLPPGDTLTVSAPYSGLRVVLDLAATRNQVVVNGLSAAFRSVLPEDSEQKVHEAIQDVAQCARGAAQLPELTTSADFNINYFWNEVPNAQSCYSAYSLWRDAADDSDSESDSFSGIARDFTSSFFEDTLPRLGELLTTVLDHH